MTMNQIAALLILAMPLAASAAAPDSPGQNLDAGGTYAFTKPCDGGRCYIRTSRGDFSKESFRAEVTATLKGGGGAGCAFFGMGCGQNNASSCFDPSTAPSLFVRLAPGDFCGGAVTVTVNGRESQCGQAPAGDGRHRFRLTWDEPSQKWVMWLRDRVIAPLFQFADGGVEAPYYAYFNVDTSVQLRRVLENPSKYAPSGIYIMRIHGTFVNFLDLSPAIQQDILQRLEAGESTSRMAV